MGALTLIGYWDGRFCMGCSLCRFCGRRNGTNDVTDGTFMWPEGLGHYVTEHGVRLPRRFVEHVRERLEGFETARREAEWWLSQG